ncbi:MAG: hypothetical protein OSB41_12605 [Kiritimatiellae bacterium]|nr:hypothetical protein [Kiritimatiellia bacterium]
MSRKPSYALLYAATTAVVVTGLVYGIMRYFLEPADAFAVVNHPLQPLFHTLHVLSAPALAIMLGVFWASHAWAYFISGEPKGRYSGLGMLITTTIMVFSGYLIQTTTESLWRNIWVWLHDVSSILWTAAFVIHVAAHVLATRRAKKALERQP